MTLIVRNTRKSGTWLLLILAVACSTGCQDQTVAVANQEADAPKSPPLEIDFKPTEGLYAKEGEVSCGLPQGRDEVYDPQTGEFHIHFNSRRFTRSAFEVKKAAGPFAKPVVFRFTGIPLSYGCLGHPLTLSVDDKQYALDASCDSQYFWAEHFDKSLFRSHREGDAVTVEFSEKSQTLLKPGTRISLEIDTGW